MLRSINRYVENRREYRRATTVLEREHHEFLGFTDVVKALLLWVETTEERVRKDSSIGVHAT